jgi:membrane-bound lytic murein transglycosylase D
MMHDRCRSPRQRVAYAPAFRRRRAANSARTGMLTFAAVALGACAPRYAPPVEAPERVAPPPPIERPPLIPQPSDSFETALSPLHAVDFASFEMPVHVNEHVLGYVDVFTGRARRSFAQWLERQGRYEALIRNEFAARELPAELIFLAMIESGYAPTAVSHASAVGLWQFMAATGRLEGLRIDGYVDERRDPVRATEAAARHLQRLHERYGSWYLAAAAYNAGSGRVDRALAAGADGQRGNDSLYWSIRHLLPLETRNYVPQLIAAVIVGTHPHLFGFDGTTAEAPLAFDHVEVPDATELAVLAEAAGIDRAVLAALNGHFVQGQTPPGRAVQVRVPAGHGDAVRIAWDAIPDDARVRTRTHTVARGESLSRIAARYGTTVAAIQTHNRIDRPDRITPGQRLVIPTRGQAAPPAARVASSAPTAGTTATPATESVRTYRVQAGDTLFSIARRHGVTTRDLIAWNALTSDVIRPGDTLELR